MSDESMNSGYFRTPSIAGDLVVFLTEDDLWTVPRTGGVAPTGGVPERVPVGPATELSYAPNGRGAVLGRHTIDPARWKRYRGGMHGDIWIDETGDGEFRRLLDLGGNHASPMWIGNRIYF